MKDNLPIKTEIRSRRLASKEPIDERCWAYMKEMREHYQGRRIYEVNPYAEVYPLMENVYAIFQESLDGAGDVWMYLIVGEEKALLIDTGFGLGNLKGLCDELSGGKELIAAITHPHIDHATGNFQFDRVYCHEYAVPSLEKMRTPHAWDRLYNAEGVACWAEFDEKDLIPYRDYEIVGVPDGYIFTLGASHEVELIFNAGHASGHCAFLDKKNRILIAGDDVISMRIGINGPREGDPYGKYSTVTEYARQMRKLAERTNEFDYVYSGHFVSALESYVVGDLADAAEAIVRDPDDYDYAEEADTLSGRILRKQKFVYGLGTIAYTDGAI